jgi:UDP-N-acetylmuramoyl-tripeptide--D-alanyl-D-alanine ligase
VVGVTGSSGKTSTKDLIAAVLARAGRTVANQGSFNNEIGAPLTTLEVDGETRFLVVEMGARGVGHIAYLCDLARPTVGVVLNVGAAHAGEFGGLEVTAQAKGELVEALPPTGLAILNADDPLVLAMASRTGARVARFGTAAQAQVRAENVVLDEQARPAFDLVVTGSPADGEQPVSPVPVQLALHGAHYVSNALAAAAVGLEAGLAASDIAAALSEAGATSRWRMEVRRREDGLVVVNDAYNANPDSMAAALRAVADIGHGHAVAVLGEMLELGDGSADAHREIGGLAAQLGFARVVAVGEGARPIADGAGAIAEVVADADMAIRTLSASLHADDVVLVKASRGVRLERVAHALLDS